MPISVGTHTKSRKKDRQQKEHIEIQRRKPYEFKDFKNELQAFRNVKAYCAIYSGIYCEWDLTLITKIQAKYYPCQITQ